MRIKLLSISIHDIRYERSTQRVVARSTMTVKYRDESLSSLPAENLFFFVAFETGMTLLIGALFLLLKIDF